MQRIAPGPAWPLFDAAATRAVETAAAAGLPPHTLMQRAGLAVARLALAIAPHARTVWVACGPGNNGGDGLEAALHLRRWGKQPVVTWLGNEIDAPPDALASLRRAREAGVPLAAQPPQDCDLAIDAMLGIGQRRPLEGPGAAGRQRLSAGACPVLAVDLPSGLNADTGHGDAVCATHTLSLLTLKPGLFTAGGRDAAGQVWLDDLGVEHAQPPTAWLAGAPQPASRPHASHKGSWGDVAVIGGAPGMGGAALLAATAALHAGAGRVFVGLLDDARPAYEASQPELMLRAWDSLDLAGMHVACGCGGGQAVRDVLPRVLLQARSLVLDADALNALAAVAALRPLLQARARHGEQATVLTPHPLEAARLLGCTVAEVQADRLAAAYTLAVRHGCVVVLKGSGTVVAEPAGVPLINPTGNARLASAGTGDVLAGLVAARLAAGAAPFQAAAGAVFDHGLAADRWPQGEPLVASALAGRGFWSRSGP
ncbi:bifunctional ADP-dependent NAD(P)H-hydrate dehydratase/NAD(P)H-hydrate epimerase [Ramlibacter tataouinensis]|uniref:Bifunctional NAD(P)H-hydrate repair enzyme n=1 Tax=Ramlibacter tataouinensis (strain ATCC BAA-407 / DSM 14655 / LMG 21543 / TTB310) TaxID=365046 RepID=F5XVR7_RAMTT|nr:bifunctional ADP-dependent NAD(P)H-hydrate dehydratase/NAD(P)H-hydrate epimerase [Ramlibacter tataouinensis]AEG92830.1 conserved hypothetical protein [Ramlibacter tataouinensis TTB310]